MKFIDFHSHSYYSDGSDDPKSLIRSMFISGVDACALTDHDTLAGYPEARKEADRYGLLLIPGVEISTEHYHILGLNVDTEHRGLQTLLDRIRATQLEECRLRIAILNSHGIPFTIDKLHAAHPYEGARLGRWNLMTGMLHDGECRRYLADRKHLGETPNSLFQYYFGSEGIAKKIVKPLQLSSAEAIRVIHDAGGRAFIAHPFKEVRDMAQLDRLRTEDIDGLEIQPNYGERNDRFAAYAHEHEWVITYGSDFHGAGYTRSLLGRNHCNNVDIGKLLGSPKR